MDWSFLSKDPWMWPDWIEANLVISRKYEWGREKLRSLKTPQIPFQPFAFHLCCCSQAIHRIPAWTRGTSFGYQLLQFAQPQCEANELCKCFIASEKYESRQSRPSLTLALYCSKVNNIRMVRQWPFFPMQCWLLCSIQKVLFFLLLYIVLIITTNIYGEFRIGKNATGLRNHMRSF